MNITLKTEYALVALYEVFMNSNFKPVTRKQIAEHYNISEDFLEKIFIGLQKKGLIRSIRGPGGGFILNKRPEEITLWDVFTAVDFPEYTDDRCYPKSTEGCTIRDKCRVKNIWFLFGKTMRESMSAIKLTDIAK
jgi:Rrf2 family iron-sulfur cluster assembly transcriptional regulator